MKAPGLTRELHLKLFCLSPGGGSGIPSVAVKCVDIGGTPVAKAATWTVTDADARKLGEQTGLDTPVVLAVNDGHLVSGVLSPSVPELTR